MAPRESDLLRPLRERPAADILKAILDAFALLRLVHFRALGETFYVCDRGAIAKNGAVPIYLEHELPLREAGELVADLLRGFPVGHAWRWRLVLCPAQERTREGIHTLLSDPPRSGRPWIEVRWMRASEADQRGQSGGKAGKIRAGTARAGAAHVPEEDRRPPREPASSRRPPRPKKRKAAQDGSSSRATMGAEL